MAPIYEFKCAEGHVTEEFRRVANVGNECKCKCGRTAKKILSRLGGFKLKGKKQDMNEVTRRLSGLKRGEQTHENIYTDEVIHLSGNKEKAKDQIRRSYMSPKVPKKLRQAAQDNKLGITNL